MLSIFNICLHYTDYAKNLDFWEIKVFKHLFLHFKQSQIHDCLKNLEGIFLSRNINPEELDF